MKSAFFCCLPHRLFSALANLRAQDAKQPDEKKPMASPAKRSRQLKTSAGGDGRGTLAGSRSKTVENFKKLARKAFMTAPPSIALSRGS
jgi:hypothetical protein